MLAQYVNALQGLLGPCLLIMGLDVLLSASARTTPSNVSALRAGAQWRFGGVLVGVAGAIIFASLRATAVIDRRSVVNLPTLICCVVCDIAALIIAIRSRSLVQHCEKSPRTYIFANVLAAAAIACTLFYATPDVILQLTNFVEPGDSPFTSVMLIRAIGFLLGVGTAVVVALIIRTMRQTAIRVSFTCAVALLIVVLCIRHGLDLIALFTNMRIIALHGAPFRAFIWVRNHALVLIIAQVAVFILPVVASCIAGFRHTNTLPNAAVVRADLARRRRAWISAIASALAIVVVWTTLAWGNGKLSEVPQLSEPEPYSFADGVATISFAQVEDGHLHRYEYKAQDGTTMRFIIIKKNGGAYGVGLDACETCGDAGYYEKDGKIICKRCDVAINIATIGFKGGCNPVPVPYKAANGAITIATAQLDALSSHFK